MDVLSHAPAMAPWEAEHLAACAFAVRGTAALLPSERDQNFLIAAGGGKFVLKIANATDDRAILEAQSAALAHAGRATPLCPGPIDGVDGGAIQSWTSPSGTRHLVRLLTWIDGTPLGDATERSDGLLIDVGRAVGELDAALDGFDHPAAHRDFHWDLARGAAVIERYAPLIGDRSHRALVQDLTAGVLARSGAALDCLPRCVVHNDPNDYNVLVAAGRVTGILDFGDLVYSYAVADLAIAIAYAMLDTHDFVGTAALVTGGYASRRAIGVDQIAVLFDLAILRLCTSACLAAHQRVSRPDDPYLAISQGPVARLLPRLAGVEPDDVAGRLRAAAGGHNG